MAYIILILAGIFEIGWAVGLKYSDNFSKLWPSVFTAISMIISVLLLARAVKVLPVGTAYAIWTAIGAIGTVIAGIILFNEPFTVAKIVCVLLIVTGIIGIKIFS